MLDSSDSQSGHSRPVHRPLPGGEFLDGQTVTLADFVDGHETAVHGSHDFGFPAHDPPGCGGRGQIVERERLTERPNDLSRSYLLILNHLVLSRA